MAFQVDGKLHVIFDTEKKTETFQAREFVIEIAESQYPQLIKFQLTQDKCELIDSFQVGDALTVHFDLRGREWNDRYFTNLNAWKIEATSAAAAQSESQGAQKSTHGQSAPKKQPETENSTNEMDFDDDIPF